MKKLALLALIVCLGVAGCDNKPAGSGTSGTSGTSAPAGGTGSGS